MRDFASRPYNPDAMQSDETWMRQALDLARRGRGRVEPNPMVGCLLVREGRVIGRGFHERFGQPHAERMALANCSESPMGATAYVTLEPCCHANKKTPPCVPGLIEAGIAHVAGACADPNPAVSGRGFAQLRAAGIAVTTGVCEAEAKQLNAAFFARALHHRPYITLKWAQSADGLLAGRGGRAVRISNADATAQIHAMRGRCDAILVGINTVFADDPLLTARGVAEARPLRRMVLDTHLRIPIGSRLVQSAREHGLWIFCHAAADRSAKVEELKNAGVRVIQCDQVADGRLQLSTIVSENADISHLLVEPGPTLAGSFFAAGLVDRAWVIRSPREIGEPDAPRAPRLFWPASARTNFDGDELTEHLNPASDVFFAAEPSADFGLI